MTAKVCCMRILVSRGLALFGVVVLLSAMLALSDVSARADGAVASPETASPATPPTATYDETQPGADDPRVKEGFVAYQAGDFKKAYAIWLPLAEAGNAEAQFRIGRMYSLGEGFKQNGEQAVSWYTKAYENGHDGAANGLGVIYRQGDIQKENLELAHYYYLKAALNNYPPSQHNLGIFFAILNPPNRDFGSAYGWLFIALENGFKDSADTIQKLDGIADAKYREVGLEKMREWFKYHPRR